MNEAELLFTQILECDRAALYTERDRALDKKRTSFIAAVLKRRICGEPIEYILGRTEFMGLDFKVGPAVLIPRAETEILVDEARRFMQESRKKSFRILDIGTGSGNIAVSLAKLSPQARICALDISEAALEIAQENAKLHKVEGRIEFRLSDFSRYQENLEKAYDLLVSNPPYVRSQDICGLSPEVRSEPRIALDAGSSGLDFYRILADRTQDFLKEGGRMILEIGFGQAHAVKEILQDSGYLGISEVVKDYSGIERVIVANRKSYEP